MQISSVLEARSSKVKVSANLASGESLLTDSVFLRDLHMAEGEGSSLVSLLLGYFKKGNSHSRRLCLITLLSPQTSSPNTITLGIRSQHMNFGKQTITVKSNLHSFSDTTCSKAFNKRVGLQIAYHFLDLLLCSQLFEIHFRKKSSIL